MNSLMNGNLLLQAMGAMMRGESPQTFLQNLAKNNPALQGLDFSNLEKTAKDVCDAKGVDINEAKAQVVEFANSNIKS